MELVELVIFATVFVSQMTSLRWLISLFRSLTVTLTLLLSSDASICSTMDFPPLGNSDHVAVSVSIDFPSNSKGNPHFIV